MDLKIQKENYGKILLIGASVLMWLLIIILFKTYGYERTWQLWKVPTQNMTFMDFRLIPGSAESFANGFEPSVENPYDPNGRIFNYPAFWRLFFYTGITQADTVWISVFMIVLFFVSVFFFPERPSIPAVVGMLAVLFSPASMLLYERGNVDLIVFVICVIIVLAAKYSAYAASLIILFGGIVKLFPVLGLSVLLKESKKKFLWLSFVCLLVLVAYMLATWDSVQASWTLTMRGDGASYGTNVFATRYGQAISRAFSAWFTSSQIEFFLNYGFMIAALVLLLLVILLSVRRPVFSEPAASRNFDAFRMGASIYVGTFLLGNNWDYRLAFLVLVVPQLVDWMRYSVKTIRAAAWLSMLLALLSTWHFWIAEIPLMSGFGSVEDSRKFWIILDETFNWMLFASLAYLLFISAPEWLQKPFRNFLVKEKSQSPPGHGQTNHPLS